MIEILSSETWSPYAAGIGIGVLVALGLLLSDKPIGCSSAYTRTCGMLYKLFAPKKITSMPYFQKLQPKVTWDWMLVIGIFIGAFISATLSGVFNLTWVPEGVWTEHFGDSSMTRLIVALIGGIIMGFGARWAGGCTSGHGISGSLQLAISSWVAASCFFIGGIATAMLIYKVLA